MNKIEGKKRAEDTRALSEAIDEGRVNDAVSIVSDPDRKFKPDLFRSNLILSTMKGMLPVVQAMIEHPQCLKADVIIALSSFYQNGIARPNLDVCQALLGFPELAKQDYAQMIERSFDKHGPVYDMLKARHDGSGTPLGSAGVKSLLASPATIKSEGARP